MNRVHHATLRSAVEIVLETLLRAKGFVTRADVDTLASEIPSPPASSPSPDGAPTELHRGVERLEQFVKEQADAHAAALAAAQVAARAVEVAEQARRAAQDAADRVERIRSHRADGTPISN